MSTFFGHALINGIAPGSGQSVTVGGYGTCFADSVPLQHVSRLTEHIGADGRTGALQWDDDHYELSLTFRPAKVGATPEAPPLEFFFAKGSTVELSGFHEIAEDLTSGGGSGFAAVLNGSWILVGDTAVTLNAGGVAEVTLNLRQYPGNVALTPTTP
jgi:hypothetical protein